mmetsp:Transcript_11114/g.11125  ORF Transcript_11114/g.11125 Transcript_11114/m.11125 type:complete len:682 (+) Transcript_11114:105-2150(+)
MKFTPLLIFVVLLFNNIKKSTGSQTTQPTYQPTHILGNAFQWSYQSKLIVEEATLYASSPFITRGQGEETLYSGYDNINPGVFVHTSQFENRVIWTMQAKLLPQDVVGGTSNGSIEGDSFGFKIAITENTLIATSPNRQVSKYARAGSAYLFNGSRNSWTLQQVLEAVDGREGDRFGVSIALHNNTVLIGADSAANGLKSKAGCVYVFNTSHIGSNVWTQQQKLYPSESQINDRFGEHMSMFNSTLIITSLYSNNTGTTASGAAYIFSYSGSYWSQQQRLAPMKQNGLQFGWSPVGGAYSAVIGETSKSGAGSVYIFSNAGLKSGAAWSLQARLLMPSDRPFLGSSLSLYRRTLLVGTAPRHRNAYFTSTTTISAALLFDLDVTSQGNTTWDQIQTLSGSPGSFLSTVYVQEGDIIIRNGSSGLLYSAFNNNSCLRILLGDHYGDGWNSARLRVELRDYPAYFTEYAPHPDTIYPLSFRYCPHSVLDIGAYRFRIRRFRSSPFIWEISYQVYLEATDQWFHGDFLTRMTFVYSLKENIFHLVSIENQYKALSCRTCTTVSVQSWVEMQSAGGDSWLTLNAFNSSFFISDPTGLNLYSYGLICESPGTYMCIQTLKDGEYLLRSGSGYGEPEQRRNDVRSRYMTGGNGAINWRFCGFAGGIFQQLYFNITAGECFPGSSIGF